MLVLFSFMHSVNNVQYSVNTTMYNIVQCIEYRVHNWGIVHKKRETRNQKKEETHIQERIDFWFVCLSFNKRRKLRFET